MRAIVVGGGIGGLTAAVALRRAGVEAAVFEKAGELREIGAGISLWANAMKALRKLGLYEAVLAVGKPLRRITLLGDAAHPMTPDLGQGACQAIEDAVVLARSLAEEGDIEAARRLYEERRADRVAYVVRQSRRLGRIGQLENPLLRRLRDATLRAIPKRVQLSSQLWQMEPVVGYEA